ncbi:AP-1 complex subunit mu-1 [Purpureocillium lavendulum]|uniref:AP-1 complex subunit mu-1 n=1 Tax=Purpureocillium lavendulum TaxID=1247861 RepID=A0AB34FP63_9HYPO|nr:AP-1 complex subunit mu-1 [Purpureocillium lavendulum]
MNRPARVDDVQDLIRAAAHQVEGDALAQLLGGLDGHNRLRHLGVDALLAVGRDNRGPQAQLLVLAVSGVVVNPARLDANGHAAAALEGAHEAALRGAREGSVAVLEAAQDGEDALVAGAALDAEGALADGVEDAAAVAVEELRDVVAEADALQAGSGEDNGRHLVVGAQLLEARLQVAADVLESQGRVAAGELGDAADAAGADDAAGGQVGEGAPAVGVGEGALDDEHVARVLALGDGAEGAAVGQRRGHVLERVHDHVELARGELLLELRRPQALAAKVVQRRVLVAVARRRHAVDGELVVGQQRLEAGDDDLGLRHGERRLARADDDGLGRARIGGTGGGL